MFRTNPPKPKKHLPHILRIKSGQTLTSRLAGNPVRTETHFFKTRTLPCIRETHGSCPLCQSVGNPRYYAYWPVRGKTAAAAAVELTELAELELMHTLGNDQCGYGRLITFHRPAGRRNNPIQISLPMHVPKDEESRQKKVQPVATQDVQATLFRLWECPETLVGESWAAYLERLAECLHNRYCTLLSASNT